MIAVLAGNCEVSAFGLGSQLTELVGDPLFAQGSAVTARTEQCSLLEAVICTPLHKSNKLKDKETTSLNIIVILTSKGSCDLSLVNQSLNYPSIPYPCSCGGYSTAVLGSHVFLIFFFHWHLLSHSEKPHLTSIHKFHLIPHNLMLRLGETHTTPYLIPSSFSFFVSQSHTQTRTMECAVKTIYFTVANITNK